MGATMKSSDHSFYMILPVHAALHDFVESILIMDWDANLYSMNPRYSYPWSATSHLFFTLANEPSSSSRHIVTCYPSSFVTGPRLINETQDVGMRRKLVGVAFKPGGMARLIGMPVAELVNDRLDASLVLGKEITELTERLKNANDNHELFTLTEQFLINKLSVLKPVTAFDAVVMELVKNNGNLPIKKVADLNGIGLRQLERRFMERIGITPKLFAKIIRFTNASIFKEAHPGVSWSQIAYEFGYADQMHLIGDFKKFSGFTPTEIDRRIQNSLATLITITEGRI